MQDDVGVRHLFQRGTERLHEVVGQLAHEPHGVGQRRPAATRELELARGRVERREQLVGDQGARARQLVEQRRLAGVRVPRDRHLRHLVVLPAGALHVAGAAHVADVAPELRDPPADVLAVDLHLRLAGTAGADAASQPRHRFAPASQPRQQVVQLRQLHLHLALAGTRMQREDVQDQRRPVDHLHAQPLLERAQLSGRQLLVQDHGVGAVRVDHVVELAELALADVRGRIRLGAALDDPGDRLGARRVGERRELVQVLLRHAAADPYQHRALPDARTPRRGERRLQHLSPVRALRIAVAGSHHASTAPGRPNSRSTSFSTSLDSVPASR